MDGIVIELQRNVLDSNIDAVTLLRKALLIAKKLKLLDFESWINKELNGYSLDDECPIYRKIIGQLKAWNPFNGWIPVLIADTKIYETICVQSLKDSIPNFTSLAKQDNTFHLPFTDTINTFLNSKTDIPIPTKYALFIGKNIIDTIIETVKTRILEWAVMLEENGIIGEGLTFTIQEKETAIKNPLITNYINNFYKEASEIQLQQGTYKSDQTSDD